MMKGIPVSTGIATGKAIVIHPKSMQIPHRNITDADIEEIVADNAHGAGKWVGMCDQIASDIRLLPVLTGLGLDELSVAPSAVLKIKKAFRSLDFQNCKAIAERALQLETAAEVRDYLENISSNERTQM
jgi:phosphoenolpyruvate-protein kinase (PTS system EI component)